MELEKMLEELENMIADASRVPFTNKCIIDPEQLGQIMDAIRSAVPLEVKQARQLLSDRDRRINEAMEEKERIIKQAEAVAEGMIAEDEIYKQARERAQEMMDKANQESSQIRTDADEYAAKMRAEAVEFANRMHEDTMVYVKDIFEYLETTLDKTTSALHESKSTLAKKANGDI